MARRPSLKRFVSEATIHIPDQWIAPLQKVVQSAEKSGRLPKDAGAWIVDKTPHTRRSADRSNAQSPTPAAASEPPKPADSKQGSVSAGDRSFPVTNRFLADPGAGAGQKSPPTPWRLRHLQLPKPAATPAAAPAAPASTPPKDASSASSPAVTPTKPEDPTPAPAAASPVSNQATPKPPEEPSPYDNDPMFAGFKPRKGSDDSEEDPSWFQKTKLGKALSAFRGKLPKPKSASVKVKNRRKRGKPVPDFDPDLASAYGVKKPAKPPKPSFDKRAPIPNFDAMSDEPAPTKSLYDLLGMTPPEDDESDNVKDIGKLFKSKKPPALDDFEGDEKTDVDFEGDEETDPDMEKSKKESLLRYYVRKNGRRL